MYDKLPFPPTAWPLRENADVHTLVVLVVICHVVVGVFFVAIQMEGLEEDAGCTRSDGQVLGALKTYKIRKLLDVSRRGLK